MLAVKKNLTLLVLLTVMGFGCVIFSPKANNQESIPQAKKLWDMALLAKGGRERLSKITSLYIADKATDPKFIGLYVFPDKYWEWSDNRPSQFGLQAMMENQELGIGYFVVGHNPDHPQVIKSDKLSLDHFEDIQLIYFLETKWFKPEILGLEKRRIKGKTVDVIKAKVHGVNVDVALDEKNHLPCRVTFYSIYKSNEPIETHDLTNYQRQDGILIPNTLTLNSVKSSKGIIELNVGHDEKIFKRAPVIAEGPEQWRLKK